MQSLFVPKNNCLTCLTIHFLLLLIDPPTFWDLSKSPVLQKVNVTVWKQSDCESAWLKYNKPVVLTKLTGKLIR